MCNSGTKTRTKDKYRVVYTDQQRLELEKEFQCNRYITMRRKSELSMLLSLSERQVSPEQIKVRQRKVRGRESRLETYEALLQKAEVNVK